MIRKKWTKRLTGVNLVFHETGTYFAEELEFSHPSSSRNPFTWAPILDGFFIVLSAHPLAVDLYC